MFGRQVIVEESAKEVRRVNDVRSESSSLDALLVEKWVFPLLVDMRGVTITNAGKCGSGSSVSAMSTSTVPPSRSTLRHPCSSRAEALTLKLRTCGKRFGPEPHPPRLTASGCAVGIAGGVRDSIELVVADDHLGGAAFDHRSRDGDRLELGRTPIDQVADEHHLTLVGLSIGAVAVDVAERLEEGGELVGTAVHVANDVVSRHPRSLSANEGR
jgi:hypothetical protein